MLQSEKTATLLAAMVAVQAEMPRMPKDKTGYGYKYTELDTIMSAIKPLMAKNGLGVIQPISMVGDSPAITTRIIHTSGEYIEDTVVLPKVEMAKTTAAQNMGAAITYMRRYALCSMLGITADEDVDGIDLSADKPATTIQKKPESKPAPKPAQKPAQQGGPKGGPDTPEQCRRIKELLKALGYKAEFAREKRMTMTADEFIQELEKYQVES